MRMLCFLVLSAVAYGGELPGRYYEILRGGATEVQKRLGAEPSATLASLESSPGWRHFPSAILVAAVLYRKDHGRDMLQLADSIGDLLCAEQEKGEYMKRLDHHRDTYMWLEAYRLLANDLGDARAARWRKALFENLEPLSAMVAKMQDYPLYQSPFIGTSPNHYSLWSSTLYLAGKVFARPEWEKLGAKVMHRFSVEQAPDGYWGEHSSAGPTTNYDYLTSCAVALYYEHSHDPAAMDALRRSTDFHKYFTYTDGFPIETVNDRNRYGYLSMWGSFGFSNFPDGRRYAEFLTGRYRADRISLEELGRMAQNALYFHEGATAPIPQDMERFAHRMQVPAGVRKGGPWMVCLSGIIATQAPTNQFYIDRQGNLSVYHDKAGLIITGAGSKRQPELAAYWEKIAGQIYHLPMSSRLDMDDAGDTLATSYSSFFAVMNVKVADGVSVRTSITPRGRASEASQNTQLCLKPGEALETGAGKKFTVGAEPIELSPDQIGGWIRHNGWTLKPDPAASLKWPVQPFNPYANGPERGLAHAVALLSVPLKGGPQEITLSLDAN